MKTSLVIVCIIFAFGATAVTGLQGRRPDRQANGGSTIAVLRPVGEDDYVTAARGGDVKQLPLTAYAEAKPNSPRAKQRSRRYSGRFSALHDGTRGPLLLGNGRYRGDMTPAAAAHGSDAIVVGRVNEARAYLTEDNTGIYSEFTVSVDETVKGSGSHTVAGELTVVREGGAFRLPDGSIGRYVLTGRGMPRVGGSYVLFLTHDADGGDYSILTGYELRGGLVFPLDGAVRSSAFSDPAVLDAGALLTQLRETVAAPARASSQEVSQ